MAKMKIEKMFAGHDCNGSENIVIIGCQQDDGTMKILEWLRIKDGAVAEAVAHSVNFTAAKARGIP